MKAFKKRVLSLMLASAMVLGSVPVRAFAEGAEEGMVPPTTFFVETDTAAPAAEQALAVTDGVCDMYVHKQGVTTNYTMFNIAEATAVKADGCIYATIYVKPASSGAFTYSYIWFGTREELVHRITNVGGPLHVYQGEADAEKNLQAYSFILPDSNEGTDIPLCVLKSDLTAKSPYNSSELELHIPEIPEAAAGAPVKASVTIRAQAINSYLMPIQEVEVASDLAESYGYKDSVEGSVSVLDTLVASAEAMLGEAFNAETKNEFLAVSDAGYVTKMFGVETTANGFLVNGGYPNDGTESPYGGYNGTTVSTTPVADGDVVDFYLYQDMSYWSDNYTFVAVPEAVSAGASFEAVVTGTPVMMGYLYATPADFKAAAEGLEDAGLGWLDPATGNVEVIEGAAADEDGKVTVTAPAEEGVYYLVALNDEDEVTYTIMNPAKLVVEAAPVSEVAAEPTYFAMPEAVKEAGIQVIKTEENNDLFAMFAPSRTQAVQVGETVYVHLETLNKSYSRIFFGAADAADKSGYYEGTPINGSSENGYTFDFAVPASYIGTDAELAIYNPSKDAWYTSKKLAMRFPADCQVSGTGVPADMKMISAGSETQNMFLVNESSCVMVGDDLSIMLKGTGKNASAGTVDRLYFGHRDDAAKNDKAIMGTVTEDGTIFSFVLSKDLQARCLNVVTGYTTGSWYAENVNYYLNIPNGDWTKTVADLEDGVYNIYGNAWTSLHLNERKSFPVDQGSTLTISGDYAKLYWTTRTRSYDKLYIGKTDASDEEKEAGAVSAVVNDVMSDYRDYTIVVPKALLAAPLEFVRHSADSYSSSSGELLKAGYWWADQDTFFFSPNLEKVGEAPEDPLVPDEPVIPADGVYQVSVETGAAMFKVTDAVLTVKDGKMTAVVTLSGTGYDYLCLGTKEEAFAKDASEWAPAVIDADGKYTYEISVESLDKEIAVASRSAKYADSKGVDAWYNRTLVFDSATLVPVAEESKTHSIEVNVVNSEGNPSGMYAMKDAVVTELEDGTYLVRMHQDSVNRNYMALVPDTTDASIEMATNHQVDWYIGNGEDGFWYTIPVSSLDDVLYASFSMTKNVEAGKAWSKVQTITFNKESMAETDAAEVTAAELNISEAVPENPTVSFDDVKENEWFYDSVMEAAALGLVNGKREGVFEPYSNIYREEFVTILFNMAKGEKPAYEPIFKDVPESGWYAGQVLWAAKNNVVNGYSNGNFGVMDKILREQIAIMLYNYAKANGVLQDVVPADLNKFADANSVDSWAKTATAWAVGAGIISGKNNGTMLDARGTATRAEATAMVLRYYKKIME